jgi:predicted  nucleic acid-binding Zn-ribbon protein
MNATSVLQRQIQRVRRRLFGQTVVDCLLRCLAGSLVAVACWFVLQPIVLPEGSAWRWPVAAGLLACGTVAAFVLARFQAPSSLAASLALDDKFDLRERVTTLLTLSPEQVQSSAGQALAVDVQQRLTAIEVGGKFPIRLSRSAAVIPVCAALLAIVAFFFEPFWSSSHQAKGSIPVAAAKEIQQQLDNLKKVPFKNREEEPADAKDKDLKELENAWDKLVKQPPPKNENQIRERVQEMKSLEDRLKDRLDNLKGKTEDLKKQLKNIDADPKKAGSKEINDLQDALAKGKMDKAMDALDRLTKKLKEQKLSKEEMQKLADQLADLQKKLERLAENKDLKDKLQKEFEEGKITKEQLEREWDRLAKEAENLKDLQDLAELLGDCKECLGRGGNMKDLEGKFKLIKGKLKAIELSDKEIEALMEELDRLGEAKDALLLALNQCRGNCDGLIPGNGMGQGKLPGQRRPVGPEPKDSKIVGARQHAESDPKAEQHITGFTKGGIFSRIPARDVGGAFKQAVQDAPEAIDRQRIPPDAADMAKGYFKKLGGQ